MAPSASVEMSYVNPDGIVCDLDDEQDLRAFTAHAALTPKLKVNVTASGTSEHVQSPSVSASKTPVNGNTSMLPPPSTPNSNVNGAVSSPRPRAQKQSKKKAQAGSSPAQQTPKKAAPSATSATAGSKGPQTNATEAAISGAAKLSAGCILPSRTDRNGSQWQDTLGGSRDCRIFARSCLPRFAYNSNAATKHRRDASRCFSAWSYPSQRTCRHQEDGSEAKAHGRLTTSSSLSH